MRLGVLLATLLVSFSASANYFKAGLGYAVGGDVKMEGPNVLNGSDKEDIDGSFMSPLMFAYGFEMIGDVHGEVELAYRKNDLDGGSTLNPTALTAAFNVVGNAPMGALSLTGGAGVTFGSYDLDLDPFDAGTAFGLQIFGGVDFPINETVSLGGELRYMTTVTDADIGFETDYSYNNTSLMFNAKFGM